MTIANRNSFKTWSINCFWSVGIGCISITKLSTAIISPRIVITRSFQCNRKIPTTLYKVPIITIPNHNRRIFSHVCAIAKLSFPIISPSPQSSISFQSNRVSPTNSNFHPVRFCSYSYWRGVVYIRIHSNSKLSIKITAPTPQCTICTHCKSMVNSRSDIYPTLCHGN